VPTGDDPDDVAALAGYATALADAVEAALPRWLERVVMQRWRDWRGDEAPTVLRAAAVAAGERVRAELGPAVRELLATDVDQQRTNPLTLVRRAVPHATAVLAEAGVPPVARDADAERLFPDDVYDLTPASFADLDPAAHEPGLEWGAAKAHVILRRRRAGR
jgi:hypothetical protein